MIDLSSVIETTRVLVVSFSSKGTEFTDTYVVTVPNDITDAQLEDYLTESTLIARIADGGTKYTASQIKAANQAITDKGNNPEGFVQYLRLLYKFDIRKQDSADICIRYDVDLVDLSDLEF